MPYNWRSDHAQVGRRCAHACIPVKAGVGPGACIESVESRYSSTSNTTLEARGETVPSSVTARTSSLKMPACSVT